ncbi:M48 family metallopeptidase [Aquibacillus rhizosphaerae]|uniref:M48 family metallopeptidase n=1 Tax=Aquibacillus rhizosphaerae TaxID=3051431 RepID=A0ABT7LB16_9BACI|nr:M48 family metallopeptidase [Aquibacillus sp. LR5S19]MDL4842390.1 M48 family metallopeptidase [Aquibacillus sp. LR5S19]
MFDYINSLSLIQTILIFLAILIINVAYMYLVRRHVERLFSRTNSIEQAMNRLRVLSQYTYIVLIAISSFFITFLFMINLEEYLGESTSNVIVSMICSFAFLGLMITVNQLVISKTTNKIRDTEATMKEETGETVRGILFIFIPIVVVLTLMEIIPEDFLGDVGDFLLPILIVMLIPMATAPFIGKMLKASAMPESDSKDELLQFLAKLKIENVQLYTWPTKKKKIANALVTGFTKKKQIYISDYMLENMTIEQVKAILAHEIGHIKKKHLWKRLGCIALVMSMITGLGFGMEWYENHVATIPIWIGITLIIGALVIGFGIIFRYVSRVHEKEADAYVLKLNIDYRNFASALLKLAELNHMTTKMGKLDESFQTHPSIARRVHWIIEQANGSIEEVTEYTDAVRTN